ncbi:MAG: hypothetical protein Q8N30_03535 [Methylococcales bacterium]|nr:hypothetical protein [Methylococcales bacterium]
MKMAKLELFESAEGLLSLINGFQDKSRLRIKEWGADQDLVFEIQKLIAESEKLKHQLQSILDNGHEYYFEDVQADFIKLLQKIDSISLQYHSRTISL